MASLVSQVKAWTKGRNKSGQSGLGLTIKAINHMREHRDWDAVAWLLKGLEDDVSTLATVKRMIRLNFAGEVRLKTKDVKHASGYEFSFTEKPEHMTPVRNDWMRVEEAHDIGKSITSKEFKDLLTELLEEKKEEKEYNHKAVAKRLYKKLRDEGINLELFINELRAEDKERRAGQVVLQENVA